MHPTLPRWLALAVLVLLLTGCGSSPKASPSPPAKTRISSTRAIQRDGRYLRSHGYTPDKHIVTTAGRQIFLVFHSVCTGSTDGHCQAVDAFPLHVARPAWHRLYTSVLRLKAIQNGFSVEVLNYAPQDPLCCPSLPPVTDSVVWTGSTFKASGPAPHPPGG